MSFIVPGLYVGSLDDAVSEAFAESRDITAVLNVAAELVDLPVPRRVVVVKRVPLRDSMDENIVVRLDECCGFIEKNVSNGRNALVHCAAGVSRSASIAIAYVMRRYDMSFDDAYALVKSKRPRIDPNLNFVYQLMNYDRTRRST